MRHAVTGREPFRLSMDTLVQKEHYRLLCGHFERCSELPEEERKRYVSKIETTDPDLARELKALLDHHRSAALEAATPRPAPLPISTRDGTRTRRRKRWSATALLILAGGAAITAALIGAQSWALSRLEAHLRREAVAQLRQTVDFRVTGLRFWATRQKDRARQILENPALVDHVVRLVALSNEPEHLKQRLMSSPSYAPLVALMTDVPPEIGGRGFTVITLSGVGLCAELDQNVGRPVAPAGATYVRRVNLGEWIVSRPYPDRQFALGLEPDYSNPVMFVAGPIRNAAGQLVAMGVFRFSTDRFNEFLAPSAAELVAFDGKSLLLNNLAETASLRKAGLIPPKPDAGTSLRVQLRDPGVDLDSVDPPPTKPENWAPTLMCLSATQGSDGEDAAGHRSLRGETVLGAWTWLPEWEMGLGGQIPLKRVLASTEPVRTIFSGLLLLPALLTAGLLVAGRFVRVRRRTDGDTAFGSYGLERPLGKGGMAEVFLARHATLKRAAAVKILSEPNPDAATIARFEREARLASQLGHPNTIQVFDYGETPDGRLYYAMEYVKGLTLAQFLTLERPLPVGRIVYLLGQIAGSLEEAHQLGLLHRDLKPSNIMVCSKGGLGDVVKVLDFGIACSVHSASEDATRSTSLVGTPAFMAPERIRAPQTLDLRSDIYSFGAVAFHLLTGRNVFEGGSPTELIYQVMSSPRPSPSQLRGEPLPAALEKLVLDCLAVDPAARPSNLLQVAETLRTLPLPESWGQEEARVWWAANRDKVAQFIQATS